MSFYVHVEFADFVHVLAILGLYLREIFSTKANTEMYMLKSV